ncbi:hypothetical protein TIFTF001_035782 [Ficus carica]|uniref:Uncharacterized protein n=1 Tax=Ficus carica TaxID=3494 RepID=A0AA88J6W0_FICCA|nr:hypothetical protein TIFTF001_035782 [Ficus carica]
MADVLVEVAILVPISSSAVYPDGRRVPEQSFARYMVQDVFSCGDKGGILAKPPCQRPEPWSGFSLTDSLPFFLSDSVPSSDVFLYFDMLLGNPPQVYEGWRDIVGDCPNQSSVSDAFSESMCIGQMLEQIHCFKHKPLKPLPGQRRSGSGIRPYRGWLHLHSGLACVPGSSLGARRRL